MILILQKAASQELVASVCQALERMQLSGQALQSGNGTMVAVLEDVSGYATHLFSQIPGVEKVLRTQSQAGLASSAFVPEFELKNGLKIGSASPPVIMAGPCSIEGQAHILHSASRVKESGAKILRGGAYKPRTSPYEFQGLGEEGLRFLYEAGQKTALPVISEVMAPEQVEAFSGLVDILQVGARNMYNYPLLKELGRSKVPVLLKRAFSATISEWLNAAEYIMAEGNSRVLLCERGIRTFETQTRNTLDLSAVALLKRSCSLPLIVDPSHATGRRELVRPMAAAAIAAGADGLLIEVHDCPQNAVSDGQQAISPEILAEITREAELVYRVLKGELVSDPASQSKIETTLESEKQKLSGESLGAVAKSSALR